MWFAPLDPEEIEHFPDEYSAHGANNPGLIEPVRGVGVRVQYEPGEDLPGILGGGADLLWSPNLIRILKKEKANAQYLPVALFAQKSGKRVGKYFLVNNLTYIDALDYDRSVPIFARTEGSPNPPLLVDCYPCGMRYGLAAGAAMFQLPSHYCKFVSASVVRRILEQKIWGVFLYDMEVRPLGVGRDLSPMVHVTKKGNIIWPETYPIPPELQDLVKPTWKKKKPRVAE